MTGIAIVTALFGIMCALIPLAHSLDNKAICKDLGDPQLRAFFTFLLALFMYMLIINEISSLIGAVK